MLPLETLCLCQHCGVQCSIELLDEIHDFWSRIDIGGEMPAGDCPICGAFCYLVKPQHKGE